MAAAFRRGCTLAPLGAARGAEALNAWEHVAFAEWLRDHRGSDADALEALAKQHQERLKEGGDWVVLPPVVTAFAQGRYALDTGGGLLFRVADGTWKPVETVVFNGDGLEILPRLDTLEKG